jgi:hypothetical protein
MRGRKTTTAVRTTALTLRGPEQMTKNLSSTKERKKLSRKSFALPNKRKYPIPDKAHARNALARVAQNGTPAEQRKVKAAVKKRFPSIGKQKTNKKAAGKGGKSTAKKTA